MKKTLAIAVALILTLGGIFPVLAEEIMEPMSLAVGVTTRMSGFFFTNKWGINSADVDLRELIHGYNTISWEASGDYEIDTTVIRQLDAFTEEGNKRYRIEFNQGLAYNNGSPITAWDYAFSALLLSSAQFAALGGAPTEMSWLLGYDAFREEGAPFAGVRVIDDLTLDLTIDGRYLPYFYEIVLLNVTPYPIGVLAPGCQVKDAGWGAYIDGPFSEELLRATILDEETGYVYNPSIAAGPYLLESFDAEEQMAQFTKNPYYAGNFEGVAPQIDEIIVVYANPQTALDDIEAGRLDLVNKVSDGWVIEDGTGRVRDGELGMVNYLRTGMTFISFACEQGPTQSVNVRRAISLCVNRDEVGTAFAQDYAMPVYGYYGMGQWMAQENLEALQKYQTGPDLEAAVRLLAEDGWVLNQAGQPYDREIGGPRYRESENGALEKLLLKWVLPQETTLSDILEQTMGTNLKAIGIEVEIVRLPFDELLARYYRQSDREYHLFSLGTNFNLAFDPYHAFHTEEGFQGESNKTGLQDEELMNLALAMRQTPVRDSDTYVERWLAFQDRFTELQPMVPLFSSVYFDFFRSDLQRYFSNAYFSWATAIVYAYVGEPPEMDETEVAVDTAF
ncbi:MAG: ABC transporter substrate-binding protein [Clostridia bacterium]|nr:ABC transporter substrate-binding protein [Clostridia bacterium]